VERERIAMMTVALNAKSVQADTLQKVLEMCHVESVQRAIKLPMIIAVASHALLDHSVTTWPAHLVIYVEQGLGQVKE
jgi:hypothetical protein